MLKTTVTVLFMLSFLLVGLSGVAQAHPASAVQLSFDNDTKILTVMAMHKVKDPVQHYIAMITVAIGDNTVITQRFTSQTDATMQKVQYTLIDAKAGDVIKVGTKCSIQGYKEATLTVK